MKQKELQVPALAWVYIGIIFVITGLMTWVGFWRYEGMDQPWLVFSSLTGLIILAHFVASEIQKSDPFNLQLIFLFGGLLLLPSSMFIGLVVLSHLVIVFKNWLVGNRQETQWYVQPFIIATHLIAGLSALSVLTVLDVQGAQFLTMDSVLVAMVSVFVYAIAIHCISQPLQVLLGQISWGEIKHILSEQLPTNLMMLLVGYCLAAMWVINPWLLLPGFATIALSIRVLKIPTLKKTAQIDAKTGLSNASYLNEQIETELENAICFGRPLAVIMADLDDFSQINNSYGHFAGDVVLAGVSRLIRQSIRRSDIVGRFGGEEFVILLNDVNEAQASAVAQRIRRVIESADFEIATSSHPLNVTISVGVASFPTDGETVENLLHQADQAMYQAKRFGKNQVACASQLSYTEESSNSLEQDGQNMAYRIASLSTEAPLLVEGASNFETEAKKYSKGLLYKFISSVIAGGCIFATLGLIGPTMPLDWAAIALLGGIALILQLSQLPMYGETSISEGVVITFAATFIFGMPGLLIITGILTLVHGFRIHSPIYRMIFNWSTHLLAGVVAIAVGYLNIPFTISTIPLLVIPVFCASVFYYIIESGLIATAIGLNRSTSIRRVWRTQFRWLAPYFVLAGFLGMLLAISYTTWGISSVAIAALPITIMYILQKRYISRTREGVQKVNQMVNV